MALGGLLFVQSITLKKLQVQLFCAFCQWCGAFADKGQDRRQCRFFPLFCPQAAGFFQFFPVTSVQVVVLGADIGHVETLLHSFPMPTVVAGRTHMPSIHAGTLVVVGGYSLVLRQVGVGQELVCAALAFYQFLGS